MPAPIYELLLLLLLLLLLFLLLLILRLLLRPLLPLLRLCFAQGFSYFFGRKARVSL